MAAKIVVPEFRALSLFPECPNKDPNMFWTYREGGDQSYPNILVPVTNSSISNTKLASLFFWMMKSITVDITVTTLVESDGGPIMQTKTATNTFARRKEPLSDSEIFLPQERVCDYRKNFTLPDSPLLYTASPFFLSSDPDNIMIHIETPYNIGPFDQIAWTFGFVSYFLTSFNKDLSYEWNTGSNVDPIVYVVDNTIPITVDDFFGEEFTLYVKMLSATGEPISLDSAEITDIQYYTTEQ